MNSKIKGKTNPHHMLDKCKRSCNLCGDLVQQKDRIQPTSKNYRTRRLTTISQNYNAELRYDPNSNFNKFLGYYTDDIPEEASTTTALATIKQQEMASSRYYATYSDWRTTTRAVRLTETTKGKLINKVLIKYQKMNHYQSLFLRY